MQLNAQLFLVCSNVCETLQFHAYVEYISVLLCITRLAMVIFCTLFVGIFLLYTFFIFYFCLFPQTNRRKKVLHGDYPVQESEEDVCWSQCISLEGPLINCFTLCFRLKLRSLAACFCQYVWNINQNCSLPLKHELRGEKNLHIYFTTLQHVWWLHPDVVSQIPPHETLWLNMTQQQSLSGLETTNWHYLSMGKTESRETSNA